MNFRKIFLNFDSLVFIVSQLAVGFLNYLFQLYASHTLSIVDFGAWSQWLAQFSVACFAGVWVQSLTTIGGLENWLTLAKSRWVILFLLIALGLSFILHLDSLMFALGWLGNLLNGFWFGYHLRTKQMKLIAFATIFGNLSKFAWVNWDHGPSGFYHATAMASSLICTFFLLFSSRSGTRSAEPRKVTAQVVLASLCLAFFTSWVPQVDLLVAPHLLSALELGTLAKIALLSKGFYFGFQVLAQILLAHQVQPGGQSLRSHHFLLLGGLGLLAVAAGAGVGSYFQWPLPWVAFSLLHITTLCLMYLCIQDLSAHHRGNWALALCLLSLTLALWGGSSGLSISIYWAFSIALEILAVTAHALKWFEKQDLNFQR